MAEPKVGTIRKNPKTGRLERLVGSKAKGTLRWRTAAQARADDLAILQRTKRNLDAVGRRVGETEVRDGVLQRFTKEGAWVPANVIPDEKGGEIRTGFGSPSPLGLNSKDYLKISAAPLRFDRPVDPTSKTGPFGQEANPFLKQTENLGNQFRNPADLDIIDTSQVSENASPIQILEKTVTTPKVSDALRIKQLESKGMALQRGLKGRKWRDELKALKAKTYEE